MINYMDYNLWSRQVDLEMHWSSIGCQFVKLPRYSAQTTTPDISGIFWVLSWKVVKNKNTCLFKYLILANNFTRSQGFFSLLVAHLVLRCRFLSCKRKKNRDLINAITAILINHSCNSISSILLPPPLLSVSPYSEEMNQQCWKLIWSQSILVCVSSCVSARFGALV